jgi:hypothetical protein
MRMISDHFNSAQLLKALQEDPKYQAVMAEVFTQRPGIPRFSPQQTSAENEALVEKIKFEAARQIGFDLLYTLLTGQQP